MRRFLLLGVFVPLGLLNGCEIGPDFRAPTAPIPVAYKEAPKPPPGWSAASPSDGLPKGDWWTLYGDPNLDKLEPLVAVSNQTLIADYDAYEQSVAIVNETRGELFPTIGLTGSATRSGSGGAGGTSGISNGTGGTGATNTGGVTESGLGINNGPRDSGSFQGSADWTPDIWGKIRRQIEANKAAAQVSAADLANATLSDQAILASDYIDLRESDALIALLTQTVAAYQRSLQITQNQANAGVATPLDVITAQTQLEGAQAALVNAGEARAQYEHAIAVLVGHAPADLAIPSGALMTSVPDIPAGIPSTLLQRRPDIAAAERTVAEENALIGVAVGAYYPDLTLSALGGFSADPIGGLFSVGNTLWSLGASASGTLFEGGQRSAAVEAAEFAYDEAVANYRGTVLAAFQQVEDNLSDLRILAQQAQLETAAVTDSARAVQISLNEYQAGTQAYTTVVTAQATLLANEQTALSVQQNRLLACVALIQALGGGWKTADLPNP
jgi:NodT family efflux transporter outer membrane factor (OMF) lipoprotein